MGEMTVFQHLLALVNDILYIFGLDDGVVLVDHLVSVLKVLEEEVHLAEVGVVRLVVPFTFFLQLLFQYRQVQNPVCVLPDFPLVVLGDDGAKSLHKGEVSLVVDALPVIIGLGFLPGLPEGFQKFLDLRLESGLGIAVNLLTELVEILVVLGVAFVLPGDVMEIDVETQNNKIF